MKANAKYTALELLTEVGGESASELFGKVPIVIGGLPALQPQQVITLQAGMKVLEIVAGEDKYVIEFDGFHENRFLSPAVQGLGEVARKAALEAEEAAKETVEAPEVAEVPAEEVPVPTETE